MRYQSAVGWASAVVCSTSNTDHPLLAPHRSLSRIHRTPRVDRTRPIIPRCPEGSPDSKLIFTVQSPPIIEGDQIRIFYTGQSGLHKPSTRAERVAYPMVGTLLLDRFVDVQLNAGSSSGELHTHPFRGDSLENKRLVFNVVGELSSKSRLRVEVVDAATGNAMGGYELDKREPLETAGLRQAVTWQGSNRLAGLKFVTPTDCCSPPIASGKTVRYGSSSS